MKKFKGTTLIEVLLYTVIAGFVVTSISVFAWNAISTKNKDQAQISVDDSIENATIEIDRAIRNASSISTPATTGQSSNQLVLAYSDGSTKTFSVSNNRIQMQTQNTSYYITLSNVSVDQLTFTNLSRNATPGIIQFQLELSHQNPDNLTELAAKSNIITSQSLRE